MHLHINSLVVIDHIEELDYMEELSEEELVSVSGGRRLAEAEAAAEAAARLDVLMLPYHTCTGGNRNGPGPLPEVVPDIEL